MDTAGAIQDAHSGLHAAGADARSRCDAGCNGGSTQDAHRRCGAERAQPRTAPHTPAAPLRLRGGAARRGRARGCGSRCWRRRRRGGLRPCPAHGPAPGAPRGPALLRGAEHGAAAGAAAGRAPAAARRPPQQEGRAGPGCGAMRCGAMGAPHRSPPGAAVPGAAAGAGGAAGGQQRAGPGQPGAAAAAGGREGGPGHQIPGAARGARGVPGQTAAPG